MALSTSSSSSSSSSSPIKPCLWFDHEAEQAARFYTAIFPDSKICHIAYYTEAGHEHHHQPAGKVLTVEFTLSGTAFVALNGGSPPNVDVKFNPAVSFQIDCKDQAEVDHYWERLLEGGGKEHRCGWVADRFGLSWQVVPIQLKDFLSRGPERRGGGRGRGGDDGDGGGDGDGDGGNKPRRQQQQRRGAGAKRAMEVMMGMVKLDIAALSKAYYEGEGEEEEEEGGEETESKN